MKSYLSIFVLFLAYSVVFGQYKEKEYQKYPEQRIFPKQAFDSLAARKALSLGDITLKGVAFTKPKTGFGYKAPFASKIYANHIIVELFPDTPYFEEWRNLKEKEEDLKRNKIVYMDSIAHRYRMTCETNARGEFTFPKMMPGKYILVGTLPWSQQGYYDQYEGSAYGGNGITDYYQRQNYTVYHSDFLMTVIELKAGDTEVNVKLK